MERVDTEWLALRAGLKPGLRITAAPHEAPAIARRFRGFGCAVAFANGPVGPGREPQALLYVAWSAAAAAGLCAAEKPMLDPQTSPRDKAFYTKELGLRLGYPPCCVAAFAAMVRAGDPRDAATRPHPDHSHARQAWCAAPDWRLNCLLLRQHARLVSFAACRFDCAAAAAQAEAVHREVQRHAARTLPVLEAMLRRPLAIDRDGGRAWLEIADGRVVRAEAPREPPDGPTQVTDEASARRLVAAEIGDEGRLLARGEPAPVFLDFSGAWHGPHSAAGLY